MATWIVEFEFENPQDSLAGDPESARVTVDSDGEAGEAIAEATRQVFLHAKNPRGVFDGPDGRWKRCHELLNNPQLRILSVQAN
jgi:hypothetical protein